MGSKVKDALTQCFASTAFRDMKQSAVMGEVLLHEGFWDLLWHVCKAMYPMYCLLMVADMRIGDIVKVKYNIHQIDSLLPQSLVELLEKWKSDSSKSRHMWITAENSDCIIH